MSRGTVGGQRTPAPIALRGKIVYGSYRGDDAETRTVNLGFRPDAVLLVRSDGAMADAANGINFISGGLALSGSPANYYGDGTQGREFITCVDAGFTVKTIAPDFVRPNSSNQLYHYVAIKVGG